MVLRSQDIEGGGGLQGLEAGRPGVWAATFFGIVEAGPR